jgi:hypothetical protein
MSGSQFQLLKQKRFSPFFITQALGAFNDNVYKFSLTSLFTYQLASFTKSEQAILVNLSAILFILPFFIFSAISGQLAEKYEKSASIRKIKLFELTIMMLASAALYFNSIPFMLFILFMMGFQSTLFGPIKFSILPQFLKEKELVGGNGLVEMGTFLAILLGMIAGTALISIPQVGSIVISIILVSVSFLGYIASRFIPEAPPTSPKLKINLNIFKETYNNFSFMRKNRPIFLSVLGISWFWFFGATILTQIPNYTKYTLGGNESVMTLLLAFFSIGIGLGSILCEKMSGHKIEIGIVPLGAIGMTVFSIDLYFVNNVTDAIPSLSISEYLSTFAGWHVLIDAALIGIFGGLFVVPQQALIQQRCDRDRLSRVIAGNNILNALFMVLSGGMAIGLLALGVSIPEIILITGILNAIVAVYIFTLVPEFIMRFLVWIMVNTLYRIKLKGLDKIPEEGACVLVCNHVSFMDALIIAGCCRRPVRFVMDHRIFKTPILSFIFRTAKAIPIASAKENPELMNQAFDKVAEYLEEGEVVCIFPEGKITSTGDMLPFRGGIDKIIQRTPVPVVPMALSGLWGSFFSRKDGPAMGTIPRRFWSKIHFTIAEPVPADKATSNYLFNKVFELRGQTP